METKETKELCTIAVMPRDRFSTLERCLEAIFENTKAPFELMVIAGGAPERVKKQLQDKFGSRVTFVFEPEYMNGCELRNKALSLIKTPLIVFVDSDIFVRPGWLETMLECQKETNADAVSPIIVDRDELIHTAGNDFYITEHNGRTIGSMELRYANQFIGETTNIPRRETDFCEVHCQMVVAETARKLKAFDDRFRENEEMDAGLIFKKAGCVQMCEPRSKVYLFYPELLDDVDDIKLYRWKWDLEEMQSNLDLFKEKWGIDINHRDHFMKYFRWVNHRVGFFSRLCPSKPSIALDYFFLRCRKLIRITLKGLAGLMTNQK